MTVWKQAFVLGGAVLLLAACDSATAPGTEFQKGDASAANLIIRRTAPTTEPTTTTTSDSGTPTTTDLCRNGVTISSGRTEVDAESSLACIPSLIPEY
jgi:hypothetical protein